MLHDVQSRSAEESLSKMVWMQALTRSSYTETSPDCQRTLPTYLGGRDVTGSAGTARGVIRLFASDVLVWFL